MLYAVMTVKNDADIIDACLTHLRRQGIDRVLVYDRMSTDGTRDIYPNHDFVKVYDDTVHHHRQPALTSELAQIAHSEGAAWVLPVDADEFWRPCGHGTLADVLNEQPATARKLYARMYQHHDFEHKEPHPKPLPKVAFRPHENVTVTNGNHDVNVDGGVWGLIEVREIQYRSFEHFVRKIKERSATMDPSLPPGDGWHHRRYDGWTPEQLAPVWAAMEAVETVFDPI